MVGNPFYLTLLRTGNVLSNKWVRRALPLLYYYGISKYAIEALNVDNKAWVHYIDILLSRFHDRETFILSDFYRHQL